MVYNWFAHCWKINVVLDLILFVVEFCSFVTIRNSLTVAVSVDDLYILVIKSVTAYISCVYIFDIKFCIM